MTVPSASVRSLPVMAGGFAAALLAATGALAHHSPAAYDMATQVTIEGTVANFEWANPHAYVSLREAVAAGEERVWQIELFSPSSMKQYGWTATTLAVGDRIKVVANPGRNRARNIAFLQTIERSGSVLIDARAVLGGASRPPPPGAATTRFSAQSLAGVWSTLAGPALGQLLGGVANLPLTPKGAAAVAEFKDTANPGRDCVPFAAPVYMILPVFRSIEIGSDAVVIDGEEGGVARTIHMNRTTHEGATASVLGDSVGRWDGAALVVDSTHFAEHRLGNGGGLPSSPAKHLVERFELAPGGGTLTYTFTIEDPEYLTSPVQGMATWAYRPDVTFQPLECNLENARRFLGD